MRANLRIVITCIRSYECMSINTCVHVCVYVCIYAYNFDCENLVSHCLVRKEQLVPLVLLANLKF